MLSFIIFRLFFFGKFSSHNFNHLLISSNEESFNTIAFFQSDNISVAHSLGEATIKHQKYIACNNVVANPHHGLDVCI